MPSREEDMYYHPSYGRDDLRHQLGSRHRGRPSQYYHNKGGAIGYISSRGDLDYRGGRENYRGDHENYRGDHENYRGDHENYRGDHENYRGEHENYRTSPLSSGNIRDRSPIRREAEPFTRSGSNTSSRSFSPDRDKSYEAHQQTQQRHKPNVPTSRTPSNSMEGSPHSSGSLKEKTPASVAETEVAASASMEPKPTPAEELKLQRLEAIKAKAVEIEKHYRQDCETFRTVVKMLVDKDPSLDKLLQAPLDQNLLEIKDRCIDSLKHFMKAITQERDEPDQSNPSTSTATLPKTKVHFPQLRPGGEQAEEHAKTGDSNSLEGEEQNGDITGLNNVPELFSPERREVLANPGTEEGSELIDPFPNLSDNQDDPSQQSNNHRLQLYNAHGVKLKNGQLSNPKVWHNITYARPGWAPKSLPFLNFGDSYWEMKAHSTAISFRDPTQEKRPGKIACGVTCYDHEEGPWCEVISQNGIRICILGAPPQHTQSHNTMFQLSMRQPTREVVWGGPKLRVQPESVHYKN